MELEARPTGVSRELRLELMQCPGAAAAERVQPTRCSSDQQAAALPLKTKCAYV